MISIHVNLNLPAISYGSVHLPSVVVVTSSVVALRDVVDVVDVLLDELLEELLDELVLLDELLDVSHPHPSQL